MVNGEGLRVKGKESLGVLFFLVLLTLHLTPYTLHPCAWAASEEVAALTQQAARTKNPEEALALLQHAVELAPEQPVTHFNYASVLFKKGQATLETGKKEDGRAIFREVEKELLSALRVAKNEPDPGQRAHLKSQCSFVLGDVNFFVFVNKEKAKGYYQEALWYDPRHPGALEARTRYGESLEYSQKAESGKP